MNEDVKRRTLGLRKVSYLRHHHYNRAYEIVSAAVRELCSEYSDDLYKLRSDILQEVSKIEKEFDDTQVLDACAQLRNNMDPRPTFWEQITAIGEEVS